ncbi:MAG: copper resistance protein NlpE [Actinobacteria bacterium]|nr:copper resistance protein NlpE [Actinomycetota bacterium]
MKAELSIKSDTTYVVEFTYLGTDAAPYEATGNWKIDEKERLVLIASDGKRVEQYFKIVSQNEVKMLDGDGNEITGTDLNFPLLRK